MYAGFGLFIGGDWVKGGRSAPVLSPVTERLLGECPVATAEDTAAALDAAAAGFKAWSATAAFARADAIHRIADEMTRRADEAARMIVPEDADLKAAPNVSVPTKFANAGQVCVTPDRFHIHDSLHDAFVAGFMERTKAIRLGDGFDPGVGMGPLINAGRLAEIEGIRDYLDIKSSQMVWA